MKRAKYILSELGRQLDFFGSEPISQAVITMAMRENEWFSREDICYAVEALRSEMLDEKRVEEWLSLYPSLKGRGSCGRRVAVIMAGNIPLVGLFDVLCVVASGNIPCVKPSSKDCVLYNYVESLLLCVAPSLSIERYCAEERYDAVIATGGDSANLYFATAFEGVPSLLRGSRHSVAVLSGKEGEAEIEALSQDIFRYAGLGCRSVSLIFVPRGYLLRLPTMAMCEAYHNNYRQTKALLTMQGVEFEDLGEAVVVRGLAEFPRRLSQVNVVEYDSLCEVESWLRENDERLQCVASRCVGHSRRVDFGTAQRPSLTDYADERDVMEFLISL